MTFDEYQEATAETAIYPEVGTGSQIALAYVALGLSEAGEIQGKVKKMIRDDGGILTDEKRDAIRAEIGDTLWYLARVAEEIGTTLAVAARENIVKLADRQARNVISGSGDLR
jgi:NTP pyrophosphatase (non-canonical NTP hydrolase)